MVRIPDHFIEQTFDGYMMVYLLKLDSIRLINSFINIEILMKVASNPSQAEATYDFKEYFIKDLFFLNLYGISKKSSLINLD